MSTSSKDITDRGIPELNPDHCVSLMDEKILHSGIEQDTHVKKAIEAKTKIWFQELSIGTSLFCTCVENHTRHDVWVSNQVDEPSIRPATEYITGSSVHVGRALGFLPPEYTHDDYVVICTTRTRPNPEYCHPEHAVITHVKVEAYRSEALKRPRIHPSSGLQLELTRFKDDGSGEYRKPKPHRFNTQSTLAYLEQFETYLREWRSKSFPVPVIVTNTDEELEEVFMMLHGQLVPIPVEQSKTQESLCATYLYNEQTEEWVYEQLDVQAVMSGKCEHVLSNGETMFLGRNAVKVRQAYNAAKEIRQSDIVRAEQAARDRYIKELKAREEEFKRDIQRAEAHYDDMKSERDQMKSELDEYKGILKGQTHVKIQDDKRATSDNKLIESKLDTYTAIIKWVAPVVTCAAGIIGKIIYDYFANRNKEDRGALMGVASGTTRGLSIPVVGAGLAFAAYKTRKYIKDPALRAKIRSVLDEKRKFSTVVNPIKVVATVVTHIASDLVETVVSTTVTAAAAIATTVAVVTSKIVTTTVKAVAKGVSKGVSIIRNIGRGFLRLFD